MQDGYVDERSVAGPLNLHVPGGAAGEAGLPLRLLDGFVLYVRQEDDSEVLAGLEQLQDGARLCTGRSCAPPLQYVYHAGRQCRACVVPRAV